MRARTPITIFSISVLFLAFSFVPHAAFADTIVGSDVSEDTTWTKAGSPYLVQGGIMIDQNATLSIEPGVVVQFNSEGWLDVPGRLLANGTSDEPVTFTSTTGSKWYGIDFGNQEVASSLQHVIIQHADTGISDYSSKDLSLSNVRVEDGRYGIEAYGSHLLLDTFSAENMSGEALDISNGSDVTLKNLVLKNVGMSVQIYVDSVADISNLFIDGARGEALAVYVGSSVRVASSTIKNVSDSYGAVETFVDSSLDISGLTLEGVYGGEALSVFDHSHMVVHDSSVTNTDNYDAVAAFSSGSLALKNVNITGGSGDGVAIFGGGFLDMQDSVISGFTDGAGIADYGSNPNYYPANSLFLTNNEIKNNYTGLSLYSDNSSYAISNNSIHDNASNGLESSGTTAIDASGNFWGDPSGPYNDPGNLSGKGNAVYAAPGSAVTFAPWLSSWGTPTDPCAAPGACASNVLFLPGIEASRLYKPDDSGGTTRLWEPELIHDNTQLFLGANGVPNRSDIYTKDIIDNAYLLSKGNIYNSFEDSMNEMKSSGTLNDWEAAPYDWRLSLDDILSNGKKFPDGRLYYAGDLAATSSPYITQELKRLAASSKTKKVTIIAHSNGGLVAKALTEKLGSEASSLIDKIIFVAVPQVGTPQAVGAILHGYDQGLPFDWFPLVLTPETARTLAVNMPSAYNLLPSENYFTQVDNPVITIDHDPLLAPWRARYGDTIHSKELLHAFLTDQLREVLPTDDALKSPIIANETLLNKAENIHGTQLDNWTPPAGVELTEIAGWGEDTLKTIIYYQGTQSACTSYRADSTCAAVVRTPALEYKAKTVLDGDGTVVVPSALWTPGAARYWVDLLGYGNELGGLRIDRKHADILEVPGLRNLIANIVTASTTASLPLHISTTTPTTETIGTRLNFTLHSPLSLDMYDNLGNHTGISTTTGFLEENIPDSRYGTFGELKYISVPSSAHTHLFMHGYATGSFTLDVNEVQGDTAIASTTFAAIPSSTGTAASLDIPENGGVAGLTPLIVDENGDGATDITLIPKTGGVVFPDFTPPVTTATTTGMLGTNGWYTANVTLTINATDTESGVAQTFSSVDGAATTTATTTIITAEGVHTVSYYSTDNAGNQETATTTTLKLDKTAPEASITISTSTKDLFITGLDNLSPATVAKTATTTSIVDEAGNTTKLTFQKTYAGALLTYARLLSVQYGASTPTALPTSLLYVWNPLTSPATLVSQTIAVDNVYTIQALYDKSKNKTTIIVLKKNSPIQTKVFPGLELVKLMTNKGVMGYAL